MIKKQKLDNLSDINYNHIEIRDNIQVSQLYFIDLYNVHLQIYKAIILFSY